MKRKPISVLGVIALVLAICATMFCVSGCGSDVKVKLTIQALQPRQTVTRI